MAWFDDFESRTFAANGTSIHLRFSRLARGELPKPALLLLHGFPQSHVMWHRVAQRLAPHYFLVMPDLRGYGDSAKEPGLLDHANYSKRSMADDMAEVMQMLGIDQFYLCGHDRGGRVAHRLALDHAHRVKKLCVIDIAPTLDMYEGRSLTVPYMGQRRTRLHRAASAGRLRTLLLHCGSAACRLRRLPRQRRHRPGPRPAKPRARAKNSLRPAGADGRARRGQPAV